MNYITIEMAKELYDLGFSFRFRQEQPDRSMTFFRDGIYFQLGGNNCLELNEKECKEIKDAVWIPDEWDLELWLEWNDFAYFISSISPEVRVECVDKQTGTRYSSTMRPVCYGLWKVIIKILKKKERIFDYNNADNMQVYNMCNETQERIIKNTKEGQVD